MQNFKWKDAWNGCVIRSGWLMMAAVNYCDIQEWSGLSSLCCRECVNIALIGQFIYHELTNCFLMEYGVIEMDICCSKLNLYQEEPKVLGSLGRTRLVSGKAFHIERFSALYRAESTELCMEDMLEFWVDRENNPKCTCCMGSSNSVDLIENRSSRGNPKGPELLHTIGWSMGSMPLTFSCNLPASDSFEPTTSTEADEATNIDELEGTKVEFSKLLWKAPELGGAKSMFGNGFAAFENDEEGCGW